MCGLKLQSILILREQRENDSLVGAFSFAGQNHRSELS